jgi:dihydrofolate reductase
MGRLVISENVILDGVVEDPTGEEGFARGGWFTRFGARDRAGWAKVELEQALGASALLLGRRSDERFAARWLDREGEWAERLNRLPKYVFSSTLDQPTWTNTSTAASAVLRGGVVDEVAKLKARVDGDIVLYASIQLARTLLEQTRCG